MGWSGGTFTRTNGTYSGANVWASDEGASIGIESARHDTHDKDLSDGINACLAKNGSNAATGDLNLGSQKITALANGTARTHAASVGQVQDGAVQFLGTTSGSANAQTGGPTPAIGGYSDGQTFSFLAGFSNTGSCTLNVSAQGAKTIYKAGLADLLAPLTAGDLLKYGAYSVTYDSGSGGRWILQAEKPAAGTWTHNWAPSAGSFATPTYRFYYARNGQVVTINFFASGTQTGAAAATYAFGLPVAVHSSLGPIYMPCSIGFVSSDYGVLSINSTTATIVRHSINDWAAGITYDISGSFSYLTE